MNAIITGATQGIGKAIAERFLEEGWSIAICARSWEDLQQVQLEWTSNFPHQQIYVFKADLSIKEEVLSFSSFVLSHFQTIDVLVNNAGIFMPGKLAEEVDGQLEMMISVNVYSAYYLTRALLPNMRNNKKGHVFNMCSVASLKAYDNGGSYSISKYALMGFSDNLRHELIGTGIRVTALMPGATMSRSWANTPVDKDRLMPAKDVASMVWATYQLAQNTDVETIVMRPILGDF